jgi:hypothetical protein
LNRILALLGLALLCIAGPAAAPAQDASPPSAPESLAVRVHVVYLAAEQASAPPEAPWEAENVKYTNDGTPAPFKLVGPNIVVFVGITPFARKDGKGVTLIAEGQVGVKRSDGGFSYQATVSKIDVGYGESVLFLPLGLRSPLRIEIAVFRAADLPTQDGTPAAGAAAQKTGR